MSLELEENPSAVEAISAEISEDILNQELEVADPTRNIDVPIEPPPAGVYDFLWKLNTNKKDGGAYFKQAEKSGQWLLNISLIGLLQAEGEEYHEYFVSDHLNSYLRRGTTSIHHFMNCIGQPQPKNFTLGVLKERCVEILNQEPRGKAYLEWKATIKRGDKYEDLAKKMSDFQRNDDGSYQPWIETKNDEGELVKVYAQGYIVTHVAPESE